MKQHQSELGMKAARENYLPDLGLIAGYSYQKGSTIYPKTNPHVGIHFKWNLQDIFSDKQIVEQREYLYQQAKENLANTKEQVNSNVEKAYRKLSQVDALIQAAREAVSYRRDTYSIQQNQIDAGLATETDVLEARADLAKSEADLYAAHLLLLSRLTDCKYPPVEVIALQPLSGQ